MARITFEFDMPEDDFRRLMGDDGRSERMEGTTVEAIAAHVVRRHDATHGYIDWRIQDEPGRRVTPSRRARRPTT